MEVAIMGAGLSGLACAITLEGVGLKPTILEKRSSVGDRFINGEILLSILSRPINDCLAYLSDRHGIYLKPVGNIRKLDLFSANNRGAVTGHLGFNNLRGRHEDSFETQLAKQLQTPITFNSNHSYEQIVKEFTHVVLATGDAAYAAKIQNFRQDLTVTLKGATVTGNFDRFSTAAWLDNNLAPQGYGYFIPLSDKEANIVIAYPDYPQNLKLAKEMLWDRFYQRVRTDFQQELPITDNFDVEGYIIGISPHPRIGNTFFVGNNLGSVMPFLGFGQLAALLSGIYAAYDICGLGYYEQLVQPLVSSYYHSLTLRRAMEQLDNGKLDLVVKSLNSPLGNMLFNTKRSNPLKLASYLLKPILLNPKHTNQK